MQRRRYLRTVGALAAAGIAGCSSDGSGGDGDDDGTGGDGGTAERGAAYHVDVAVGELNTAAIALADYQQRFGEGDDEAIQFDADRQNERLATAREALDAAAGADPTEEQSARIEGLRTAADAIAAASAAVPDLRSATDDLDDVEPAIRDREFSTARDRLSAPMDTVASVADSVSDAAGRLDGLPADRMDATNLRFSELRDGISELSALVGSFDTLLSGFDALIGAGESIQTARSQFDDGAYDDARASLEEAGEQAGTATAEFESGIEDAPERLRPRFETAACQSGHLADAIEQLDAAARTAAEGGDASDERQAAEDALDAIEDC